MLNRIGKQYRLTKFSVSSNRFSIFGTLPRAQIHIFVRQLESTKQLTSICTNIYYCTQETTWIENIKPLTLNIPFGIWYIAEIPSQGTSQGRLPLRHRPLELQQVVVAPEVLVSSQILSAPVVVLSRTLVEATMLVSPVPASLHPHGQLQELLDRRRKLIYWTRVVVIYTLSISQF